MTTTQAKSLLAFLVAAFPTMVVEAETLVIYRDCLRALPWRDGRTQAAIRGLVIGRQSPHLPAIGEVLSACGVTNETHRDGTNAARQLNEALEVGGTLAVDLRSMSGWSVVVPGEPKPRGVLEAEHVAAESARPALPVEQPGPRALVPASRLAELAANLGTLGALKRVERRRIPRPSVDPAVIEAELQAIAARVAEATAS